MLVVMDMAMELELEASRTLGSSHWNGPISNSQAERSSSRRSDLLVQAVIPSAALLSPHGTRSHQTFDEQPDSTGMTDCGSHDINLVVLQLFGGRHQRGDRPARAAQEGRLCWHGCFAPSLCLKNATKKVEVEIASMGNSAEKIDEDLAAHLDVFPRLGRISALVHPAARGAMSSMV